MIRSTAMTLTATAILLATGCGDDETTTTASMRDGTAMKTDTAMKSDTAMAAKSRGATVKVVASDYGPVIADRKGEAYYLFDREQSGKPRCYGDCAVAWPPVLTKGQPRAGKGAKAAKLGTSRRRDGKLQVTYAGHPLYYYKDDSPGKILCQDVDEFGGRWLVVEPSGAAAD